MDEKLKIKYIVAFLYGDGYIGRHGHECRFQANNIADNLDYILWRKEILENITPVTITTNKDERPNRKEIVKTFTRTHPIYSRVHERMYLENKKVIDPHYLKLFDWETLAIWYMDDGSLRLVTQDYKESHYVCPVPTLATNCFSYGEQMLIKQAAKEKLGIEFNINKHSVNKNDEMAYNLVLARSSFDRFYNGVKEFIKPSFLYKINPHDKPHFMGEDIVRTTG
jgi:hypothetical protein